MDVENTDNVKSRFANSTENNAVKKPVISFVVPVFNTAACLRRCLDSLISQTLNSIEIICVNNASTDNSGEILNEYRQKDARIHVLNLNKKSPGAARNLGLSKANGKYILFVDSDDFVELNMGAELYREIEETNVDVVQFDFNVIRGNSCTRRFRFKEYSTPLLEETFYLSDISGYQHKMSKECWHEMYSISFLRKNQISFLETKMGEDFYFWNMLYAANPKMKVINKVYYNYCKRLYSAVMEAPQHYREGIRASRLSLELVINSSLPKEIICNYVKENLQWVRGRISLFEEKIRRCADRKRISVLRNYAKRKVLRDPDLHYLLPLFAEYLAPEHEHWWECIFSFKDRGTHKIINFFGLKIRYNKKGVNAGKIIPVMPQKKNIKPDNKQEQIVIPTVREILLLPYHERKLKRINFKIHFAWGGKKKNYIKRRQQLENLIRRIKQAYEIKR